MKRVLIDYNRLISEISDESAFVLLGNNRVRSLQKLSEILPTIPDSSFYEHVNDSKNDFSSWIKHCFNDELLAEKVSKLRTKQEVSDAIISRLSQAKEALRLKQEQVLPDKIEQSQIKDEPTIIAKTQKVDNSTNDALSVNQVNDITIPDISQTNNTVQELKTTQLNDEKVNIENKSAELNQLEPLNNAQDLTLDDNLDANLDTDLETPNPKIKDTNITGEKLGLKVNDTQTNNTTDIKLENNSDTSLDASLDNALDSNLDSSLDSDLGVPINLTSSVTTQEIKENDSLKDKDKILEKLSPIIENSKIEEIKIEPVIKIETIIEKPPIVEVKEETVKPVIVEQPSQVNMLSEDNKLTDEEKLLLITDNKNLSPKQIFKKIKLQKTISSSQLNKSAEVKISKDIYETTKSKELSAQENSVSAVDILNISDEEFQSLLGINSNDKYIATLSDSSSIKQKKRRHLKTGVEGFDDLIDKGILEGSSVLVSGGPGSGKTTFCIQQLGWAAEHGEKCLFISLEEKEENLIDHMKGYGLNPEKYIKDETLKIKKLDSFKLSRSVEALLAHARGELMIDIAPVLDIIPDNYKPDRVVLDSLSSIAAAFAGRPEEYRIYVEQLFNIFGKLGVTSFIITEIQGSESSGHGGVEDFLADGVINFYNMKKGTIRQSAVEVLKMRGVNHKKKIVPFGFISGKGLEVYPLEEVFHGD